VGTRVVDGIPLVVVRRGVAARPSRDHHRPRAGPDCDGDHHLV